MSGDSQIKASLFVTCIVDQLYPEVGVSVVRVLRRLGVDVDFPQEQTCCGQPVYNTGFKGQARLLARRILSTFAENRYVVVPSGSCAVMMRVFYPELFQDDPALLRQAQELSAKVYEFSEFLVKVLGVEDLGASCTDTVTYPPGCHQLRGLEVRDEPRSLLRQVRGLELRELPQADSCCGFGGAFSVKFPHISEGMLSDKVTNIMSTEADALVSCDMGCLMHIGGALSRRGSGIRLQHLAQVLDQRVDPASAA